MAAGLRLIVVERQGDGIGGVWRIEKIVEGFLANALVAQIECRAFRVFFIFFNLRQGKGRRLIRSIFYKLGIADAGLIALEGQVDAHVGEGCQLGALQENLGGGA